MFIVAAPCDAIIQPQIPTMFTASRPEFPKYISTIKSSSLESTPRAVSPSDHVDMLQTFLATFINHWVSSNPVTGTIAQYIAQAFPQTFEVTTIEPMMARCHMCCATTTAVTVVCSTVSNYATIVAHTIQTTQVHPKLPQS